MEFETITLNDNKLTDNEINVKKVKARALLFKDENVLVINYGDNYLFPGGKAEKGETYYDTIKRELKEEIGVDYSSSELSPLLLIHDYQNNYPTREGDIQNRKISTYYFIGCYKDIDLTKTKRSESEKKARFDLELMSIDDLYKKMEHLSDNPRSIYFSNEMNKVLQFVELYKN